MSGVRIEYGGVAVGAKSNFFPSATDAETFVDFEQLQRDGLNFPNYSNVCDMYSVMLDGSPSGFPDNPVGKNLGWWSNQVSDENGIFETPIVLTLTATEKYSSSGITLVFDVPNEAYSNDINIKWYDGDTLLNDVDFQPDAPYYFCSQKVEYYNKVVITFKASNLPFNRLKVHSVEYGSRIVFYGEELRNAKVIQEINLLSTEISINTFDFTLDSKHDIDYVFQERQPVNVYFNDKLRATSFVKTAKRRSKNLWDIQSEDYIGILDGTSFYGDIYSQYSAETLLSDIFTTAKVPFKISTDISDIYLSGYLPISTCREALMQVAFATGLVVDTSDSDVVEIYRLDEAVTQSIPLERIKQGQSFEEDTRVTAVEVTGHFYLPANNIIVLYNASENGEGDEIFVKFNEPMHSLEISNGTILSASANYAIINIGADGILRGKNYKHRTIVRRKTYDSILATDLENVVSITDATLIKIANLDKTLKRCYNYYSNNNFANLQIVESKHEIKINKAKYGEAQYGQVVYGSGENDTVVMYDEPTKVGQLIECDTEYLGILQGRIIKQTFNLNGNILIKETELKR